MCTAAAAISNFQLLLWNVSNIAIQNYRVQCSILAGVAGTYSHTYDAQPKKKNQ